MLRSVVVPAYNEERRLPPTLQRIAAHLKQVPGPTEIIVVDDGSRDATASTIDQISALIPPNVQLRLLRHERNLGKGAAVRDGCLAARGQYVLFTDADLATPIEEASKLYAALDEGYDVAIGCRLHPTGEDQRDSQPLYRRALGHLYHFLVGLLVLRGIPDTQCGFKAFTLQAAHILFRAQHLNSIVFDTEVLFLAQRHRFRVAQIPVSWSNVGGSRMRVTLGHALRVFGDLISIRLRHLERTSHSSATHKKTEPS